MNVQSMRGPSVWGWSHSYLSEGQTCTREGIGWAAPKTPGTHDLTHTHTHREKERERERESERERGSDWMDVM